MRHTLHLLLSVVSVFAVLGCDGSSAQHEDLDTGGRPDETDGTVPDAGDPTDGGPIDGDGDRDGLADPLDNCPSVPNPDQADTDRDGVGDVCDVCVDVPDPDQADADGDGIGDACRCSYGSDWPIQAAQNPDHPCYKPTGEPIELDGIVVTSPFVGGGFFAGEPEGGPWSGIWVYLGNQPPPSGLDEGSTVRVRGSLAEYHELTEVMATSVEITGTGPSVTPTSVTTDQACTDCAEAESFESVLVVLTDVTVTNGSLGFGEYEIQPQAGGTGMRVDDLFVDTRQYTPAVGNGFASLTGVLTYSYSDFKLEPRSCDDMLDADGQTACRDGCNRGAVTVAQLKDTDRADLVPPDCRVSLAGLVVTSPVKRVAEFQVFFAQEAAGGPWSGLLVAASLTEDLGELAPGKVVALEGTVIRSLGATVLLLEGVSITGERAVPAPALLQAAELGDSGAQSTRYDGVLVRVEDVVTVQTPLWLQGVDDLVFEVANFTLLDRPLQVRDAFASGFACAWASPASPCVTDGRRLHQRFESITGCLDLAGSYQLIPRTVADLVLRDCGAGDTDCDGVANEADLCPSRFDPAQGDGDGDGVGDRCDVCLADADGEQLDGDGDGVGDRCDLCDEVADPGQEDRDGDGQGDACDDDADGDGVDDAEDDCPWVTDPAQLDTDGDGTGDACESVAQRIVIDGEFGDWASIPPSHLDPAGDTTPGATDFTQLRLTDDGERLLLNLRLAQPLWLGSATHDVRLYIDFDDDPATGLAVAGIGADLELLPATFGGAWHTAAPMSVGHLDLGFVSLPTYASRELEMALDLDSLPPELPSLAPGMTIKLAIHDGEAGDGLPDDDRGVAYELSPGGLGPLPTLGLARAQASDLRVVSWNVHADGLVDPGLAPRFQRVLQALDPDVVVLQELAASAGKVNDTIAAWLGGAWQTVHYSDLQISSRWPWTYFKEYGRGLLVVFDRGDAHGGEIAIWNLHLYCCEAERERRAAADLVASVNRQIREGALAASGVPADVPILMAGDLNLVATTQPLDTLATGDILNESTFGPDRAPDLDDSELAVVAPRHCAAPFGWTFRGKAGTFWASRLDFVLYSDAAFDVGGAFVLDTKSLGADELDAASLQEQDTDVSDHLPVVVDLRPTN